MRALEDVPVPFVRTVPGVVVADGAGVLGVNVGGSHPAVVWPAGYIPTAGDAVRVRIVDGTAEVVGVQTGPRPIDGTVSGAAVSGRVPVTTTAGVLQCRYVGTAPGLGVYVRLDWQATSPWIWPGAAATVPAPTTPDDSGPPPPPTTGTGTLDVPALDSGTFASTGSWSSFHANRVLQGTYGGTSYRGAWFYGLKPRQLQGRTITRLRIRLAPRERVGNYNAPLTLRVFRHPWANRPSTSPAIPDGPELIVLGPGDPGGWKELPTVWGQWIVDGAGGIAIDGGDYGGVTGVGPRPTSGQLKFDWKV